MAKSDSLTIDLHGKRLEDAIRSTSFFLERVRRAWSSAATTGSHGRLMVTIVTGTGSHSAQGPVLRNAVKRLLDKRGMTYSLANGRGAYVVDALSGCELHGPAPAATSTKVVTADRQEFQRMASLGKKRNGDASMAQNLGAVAAAGQRSESASHARSAVGARGSHNPLPAHAVTEDELVKSARQRSAATAQRRKQEERRRNKMEEQDLERAVRLSKIEQRISKNQADEETELLEQTLSASAADEEGRRRAEERRFREEMERALAQSANYEEERTEEELIERAMRESVVGLSPEERLLHQVIAASLAEEDAPRRTSLDEEDLIRQVLEESTPRRGSSAEREFDREDEPKDERPRDTTRQTSPQKDGHQYDDDLEKALKLSAEQAAPGGSDDDHDLERALELSKEQTTGFDILAEVMRLSAEEEKAHARVEDNAWQPTLESKRQC